MPRDDRDEEGTRPKAAAKRAPRKRLIPWSSSPVVLLVEDDVEMREMLAFLLRRDGCRVVEMQDGSDAITWLGAGAFEGELQRVPALIVSDIRLPAASGLDILAGISRVSHGVPVILITGFGDEETHARARALGAERVLDKPFAMSEFRAAVASALGDRERPRPLEGDGHVV
jgi:DNA-binding response OmpR family regulator